MACRNEHRPKVSVATYYVSKECKLIPEAVDKELTRLDEDNERLLSLVTEAKRLLEAVPSLYNSGIGWEVGEWLHCVDSFYGKS